MEAGEPQQLIFALESLLVAAFNSPHKPIVNATVTWWNQKFEGLMAVDYPEKLKPVLLSLRACADIVLPGLEDSSADRQSERISYVESQDDMQAASIPFKVPARTGALCLPSSHPPRSSAPKKLPTKTGQRAPTLDRKFRQPRLRHNDSQVEFTPIQSSPMAATALESQLMTERQLEVRDRQREHAALYPEMQSSPGPTSPRPERRKSADLPTLEHPANPPRAATPQAVGTFDDYVASTPTPRRGQAIMPPGDDLPESPTLTATPPTTFRRNPLAAEIQSRSQSKIMPTEWEFSSSPAESPNPVREAVLGPVSQRYLDGDITLPEVQMDGIGKDVAISMEQDEPDGSSADIVEDTMMLDVEIPQPLPTIAAESKAVALDHGEHSQEPFRSDRDLFVDGAASPLPVTPKRSDRLANRTKSASPLKVVVELQVPAADLSTYRKTTETPEKVPVTGPSLDCIVVSNGPKAKARRGRGRPKKVKHADVPSTPPQEMDDGLESPSKEGAGRAKRKRAASHGPETGGKKRRSHGSLAEPDEEVPHSQAALVPGTLRLCRPISAACLLTTSSPDGLAAVEDVDAELLRSPMQYSTQDSPFDASSHASRTQQRPEALDEPIMDVDSPRSDAQEALLQSQIALESLSQRDKEREAVEVKGAERSRREDQVHESVQVGQDQGASATGREEERAGREAVGKGHSIMETLRSGLKELKTAALSRTEVYEIESMFMDIKRELYEAELRGRASALNS